MLLVGIQAAQGQTVALLIPETEHHRVGDVTVDKAQIEALHRQDFEQGLVAADQAAAKGDRVGLAAAGRRDRHLTTAHASQGLEGTVDGGSAGGGTAKARQVEHCADLVAEAQGKLTAAGRQGQQLLLAAAAAALEAAEDGAGRGDQGQLHRNGANRFAQCRTHKSQFEAPRPLTRHLDITAASRKAGGCGGVAGGAQGGSHGGGIGAQRDRGRGVGNAAGVETQFGCGVDLHRQHQTLLSGGGTPTGAGDGQPHSHIPGRAGSHRSKGPLRGNAVW